VKLGWYVTASPFLATTSSSIITPAGLLVKLILSTIREAKNPALIRAKTIIDILSLPLLTKIYNEAASHIKANEMEKTRNLTL